MEWLKEGQVQIQGRIGHSVWNHFLKKSTRYNMSGFLLRLAHRKPFQ
jgi:hypothetical protein